MFEFTKATKKQIKARIALIGPSGSGKTYTALTFAQGLGERIAVIDTENGSASRFSDIFSFDVLSLDEYSPATYVKAIRAAEDAGFDVLIIDSLSHAWMGKGGVLEAVDKAAKRYRDNKFAAWGDVNPQHNALVEALIQCKVHLIVTMRSKTEYAVQVDEATKKSKPVKIGLAPIQRDGLEYEFDIVADLDIDHNLIVSKTRCHLLDGLVVNKPTVEVAKTIKTWLGDGDAPTVEPEPEKTFNSIDDLLFELNVRYNLGEAEAKQVLKDCGYKAFAPSKAGEMLTAVSEYVNGSQEKIAF